MRHLSRRRGLECQAASVPSSSTVPSARITRPSTDTDVTVEAVKRLMAVGNEKAHRDCSGWAKGRKRNGLETSGCRDRGLRHSVVRCRPARRT